MSDRQGLTRQCTRCLRARRRRGFGSIAVVVMGACLGSTTVSAGERHVVVGDGVRRPVAEMASALRIPARAVAATYAATGRIECGGVRGVGQLTARGDTVTSAAHVLFDEQGRSRAAGGRCVFMPWGGQGAREWRLTPDREACGSTSPYAAAGHRDWAVARLESPIPGIRPHAIGGKPKIGERIAVVAPEGQGLTVELCRVRDLVASPDGEHEIRTDCSGYDGLSGAAYLTLGANPAILGLHAGFRSSHPDSAGPYAADHYTFGAALAGAFARTLRAAAR